MVGNVGGGGESLKVSPCGSCAHLSTTRLGGLGRQGMAHLPV